MCSKSKFTKFVIQLLRNQKCNSVHHNWEQHNSVHRRFCQSGSTAPSLFSFSLVVPSTLAFCCRFCPSLPSCCRCHCVGKAPVPLESQAQSGSLFTQQCFGSESLALVAPCPTFAHFCKSVLHCRGLVVATGAVSRVVPKFQAPLNPKVARQLQFFHFDWEEQEENTEVLGSVASLKHRQAKNGQTCTASQTVKSKPAKTFAKIHFALQKWVNEPALPKQCRFRALVHGFGTNW